MNQALLDIQRRLAKITVQQQELLQQFTVALDAGDAAKQATLQKQLARLMAEMGRLGDEQRYAQMSERVSSLQPRARATGKTIREQVLDVLDEIGVALSPSTVSEFIQATTGVDIAPSRFASLRRDEERAARRDVASRPAWVVPALSTSRFNTIPRLLTSSAWELERRLIGARSMRVNHLHITLAFLVRFEQLKANNAPQAAAIESLVLRYARGIPGAVASGSSFKPDEIRAVVSTELALIEEDDRAERHAAAAKLNGYSDRHKLWGLPSVIEGGSQQGSAGG